MSLTEVYLGLGSNMGDSLMMLQEALVAIAHINGVQNVESSHFYITAPVGGPVDQSDYLNAACRLKTLLPAKELCIALQAIEKRLGKKPQTIRNAPRSIDIDILFFGLETHTDPELEIPHPRWKERLFVLAPLADLTRHLTLPEGPVDLHDLLKDFPPLPNDAVRLFSKEK